MAKVKLRVVLDTNILISAIIYSGIPKEILLLILADVITGITSATLLTELKRILREKFLYPPDQIDSIHHQFIRRFVTTHTHQHLKVVKDDADNRVLEAALAGKVQYIVTGDKELLSLKKFHSIKIVNPREFLNSL